MPGDVAVSGAETSARSSQMVARRSAPGCGSRIDRRALRTNHSAPAGIRRAHSTAHPPTGRSEPAAAREFTGTALRILLEVLDRRRPVAQLGALCAPALVHTVGALVAGDHIPSRTLGAAVLTKFGLFPIDDRASELLAMYQRGPRRLALAGRIEYTPAGWKMTALRLT